jgi:hypothetical protein
MGDTVSPIGSGEAQASPAPERRTKLVPQAAAPRIIRALMVQSRNSF